MSTIPKTEFINPFKQTMGAEKAVSLFNEIIQESGLPSLANYTAEQGKMILDRMKARGGLVRIMALNITTRLVVSGKIPHDLVQ